LRGLPRSTVVLHDLKASYDWLNGNLNSISTSDRLRDERIFLNVDDPDSDEWTWLAASDMALETHDLSAVRAVRRFLLPYHCLLKAAGVLEAVYPTLNAEVEDEASEGGEASVQLQMIRARFASMREAGHFTDVQLVSSGTDGATANSEEREVEGENEVEGLGDPQLRGHRDWLSAVNNYFNDMFGSGFVEGQVTSSGEPVRVRLPYSPFTLKVVLGEFHNGFLGGIGANRKVDFLYMGTALTGEAAVDLSQFLEVLLAANLFRIQGLFSIAQREIVQRRLVDPDNLQEGKPKSPGLDLI